MQNGFEHILETPNKKKKSSTPEYLQRYSDSALENFALANKDRTQDVKQFLKDLFKNEEIMAVLVEIAHLQVFSREMHKDLQNNLPMLAALKQLKYFYCIPIGQLVTALTGLLEDMPSSGWWSSMKNNVLDSEYCQMKTCDFFKTEGKFLSHPGSILFELVALPRTGVMLHNNLICGFHLKMYAAFYTNLKLFFWNQMEFCTDHIRHYFTEH